MIDLSRLITILDVPELTGLSWDTVKDLVKKRLAKDYAYVRLRDLRRLAIDEIYPGRKMKYLTLVIDQESGRILRVGCGRAGEVFHGFWRRLKSSGARIEAVAMDMSQAYAAAVAQHLPEALIVFDRFHVMKLMNEKLDDLRRELVREAESQEAKVTIKGTRWLLLSRLPLFAGHLHLKGLLYRGITEATCRQAPIAAVVGRAALIGGFGAEAQVPVRAGCSAEE